MALRNLIEGHLRNISTEFFENRSDTFREEDCVTFHYSHIRQNSPALWPPCCSTNQHGFKESDRGSPKENFYKQFWKSANQFWRRRFLKFFSFRYNENQNSAWIPKNWRNSGEVIVRMLPVKFHPNWPTGYWGEKVDERRTMNDARRTTHDGRRTKGHHNNKKSYFPKNILKYLFLSSLYSTIFP